MRLADPFSHLRALTLDLETGVMSAVTVGGVAYLEHMPSAISGNVLRATYDHESSALRVTFVGVGEVAFDVGSSTADGQMRDAPVVYLDQNHWIALAQASHAPEKLTPETQGAARSLIERARARQIILPLSGAHMTESAKTYGRRRQQLVATMLQISRGWVMRDVLSVRRRELRAVFLQSAGETAEIPAVTDVFTLDAEAVFTEPLGYTEPDLGREAPRAAALLHRRLTTASAVFSVLAEDEKTISPEGRALAAGWAQSHADLATHIAAEPRAKALARDLTRVRFTSDMAEEIAEAARSTGLDPARFRRWLVEDAEEDLARLPYLGRAREVTHHRLMNAEDRWEANDLNDLHFLSCAAGYADVVIGEKKFTHYLRRANSTLGEQAALAATLEEGAVAVAGHLEASARR